MSCLNSTSAGQSAAVNLKVFDPLWKFPTWQPGTGNEITAHNRAQLSKQPTLAI